MWGSITAMPSSIFLPDKVAAALDRDVLAAWAHTDRPTAQALIAAGLPVPLEVTDGAPAAALARYTATGLKAELAGADVVPREWPCLAPRCCWGIMYVSGARGLLAESDIGSTQRSTL